MPEPGCFPWSLFSSPLGLFPHNMSAVSHTLGVVQNMPLGPCGAGWSLCQLPKRSWEEGSVNMFC